MRRSHGRCQKRDALPPPRPCGPCRGVCSDLGMTTSSEITTGLPAVTPAGVGSEAAGPGDPPGPEGTTAPAGMPAGMPPSTTVPPPSQELQPDETGADSQHCDCDCWPQTRGAAAGAAIAAPGGVNPGGRCPKHFSYFQTSIAMYRSLSDLQPLADITATTAVKASSRRAQSCARIDPSPRTAVVPADKRGRVQAASCGRHQQPRNPTPRWSRGN